MKNERNGARLLGRFGGMATAVALAAALAACGSSMPELGTKADGAESFQLTNEIGQHVTAVAVRAGASEDDFPASFMAEGQTFESGATDEAYLPADVTATDVDLLFTCDDGTQVLVDDVDMTAADAYFVKYEDGVGFLTYKDADGNDKSTKDASVAAQQAREQKKADQEAADAVAKTLDALPSKDALTTDDETAITDARSAYDALTDAQKELVPSESLAKLTDDEAQLQTLKQQADEQAAAEKAAQEQAAQAAAAAQASSSSFSGGNSSSYSAPAPSSEPSSSAAEAPAPAAEPAPAPAQSSEDCTADNIVLDGPAQSSEDCTAENIVLDN